MGKNSPVGATMGTISINPGVTIGTLVTKVRNWRLCRGEASSKALIRYVTVGDDCPNLRLRATPPSPPMEATATNASAAPLPP